MKVTPAFISSSKIVLAVMIAALLVVIGFGTSALSLKRSRDTTAEALAASERKVALLSEKAKEEKAQAGRLQRTIMVVEGQLRQAKMESEKIQQEIDHIKGRTEGELKRRIEGCEAARTLLDSRVEKLTTDLARLEAQYREVGTALKAEETEAKRLKGENQTLKSELKQSGQDNQRFRSHNVKLSQIARALLGRLEKEKLGGSILVKEPVLQFEKVELERMIQEYLDQIDEHRAVN
jgi:chromosome segregation ATPase